MSKRRRVWKESLKPDSEDKTLRHEKRGKIKILKDETFKNVEGELILVSSTKTNKMEFCNNNISQESKNTVLQTHVNDTPEDGNRMLKMTPHHQLSQKFNTSIDNLTPTFRNPDNFLAETKEVMKSITPVKLFPVPSETQLKETFTVIPPYYYTEKNKEFHNLNNIQSILSEHNNEASGFAETFYPDEEPLITNSCSFTVQVEVEHDIDQEHNDNLLESLSVKNDEAMAMVDQNSVLKTNTDEIEIFEGMNEESKNIKDNNNNGVVIVEANNTNSCSKQFLKIIVTPEMHNEPRMKNHDDSEKYEKVLKHNHIIDENKIEIEQEIIIETEDKTEEEETLIETEEEETLDTANETTQNLKKKRPKRNIHYNKSYLDYMSEEELLLNEAFPSEASSADYSEESSDLSHIEDEDKKDKKNKKSKKKSKKDVKIKKNTKTKDDHNISAEKKPTKGALRREAKKKKEMGESYKNNKGELIEGKSVKPNPCIDTKCGNGCGDIPEEKSQRLFSYFWGLNSNQRRKDWIAQCAVKKSVKRPNKESTRSCTYDYFINEDEGRRKVCQKYLINTLDVTQRFILYTLDTMLDGYAKTDERGKNGGSNKTKEEVIEHARSFIESLPTMPSHYCRKDSKRVYFPEEFKNKSNLYHIYKNNCKQSEIKPMSYQVFNTWFIKTYNIGFHVPKKDKCAVCSNKNNEEKTEEEKEKIDRHVKEKEESYKRFKYHQTLHGKDKRIICASFDMQKVLNTPHGDSMMLYYSRKFAVYNLTIYESNTRRGYCNVWTEADAHRGANEISTCLYKYIIDLDSCGTIKTVLLYCDSCYGQNKNKTTLSMIRYALSQCKTIKTIQINYLIPGHTYMPVDSVHATIENKIKKSIIWAPSQWPTIMEFARQEPQPYKVNVLKGKDFIGFDNVIDATFKKNQKISISKLNIATFKKQEPNIIYIKNSMLPDAETTEINLLPLKISSILKENLYPAQLGISAKKHKDLINLVSKNIIPSRFAIEYKNLKISTKVKDTLMDTDEEDVTEITDND